METEDALIVRCQERVGRTLRGKWRLDKLLGIGGMGAVYEASHRNGARAAIKLLHADVAGVPDARERFSREAYIANTVGHEGAVAVLDDDTDEDGAPFLVMELLVGESAAAHVAQSGPFAMSEVLSIASKTLAVLEHAHGNGVVHRDIKPENLFLTVDGTLKVLDFGIARLEPAGAASRKLTRTGFVMGTPGYMAPEQALGHAGDITARTDLWAVGATMFNLLTGRDVHEGETAGELLVHSATRPAPSLARVMPEAPLSLVQIVDRALAFDPGMRYPDAAAMRADVDRLAAAGAAQTTVARGASPVRSGGVVRGSVRPPPAATLEEREIALDAESFGEVTEESGAISALREFLKQLEKAMLANVQYGTAHKESGRRFDAAYRQALTAIALGDGSVAWNITPYAFVAGKEVVWEPKPPLDSIPYRLFADGLRLLSLQDGLQQEELAALAQIWMRDAAREIAPEDDLATLMWDADLPHVGHEQIDSFAEGDQDTRAHFEADRQKILALASFDTGAQLEECWSGRAAAGSSPTLGARHQELVAALNTETAARAAMMTEADASRLRPHIEIDGQTLDVLDARMGLDLAQIGERFVLAAAWAIVSVHDEESAAAVLTPLRAAAQSLSTTAVADAVGFICALCRAVNEVAPPESRVGVTGWLADALVSSETLERMLAGVASEYAEDLAALMQYLDAGHLPVVLEAMPTVTDPGVLPVLTAYVARCGAGHEAEIGALMEVADVELALALVRLLVALGTPAAREALGAATRSQHPVVRIEALGYIEGLSSDRLRLELKRLLEDDEAAVRLATLRAIAKYAVRVAGPSLVLRIRSAEFDGLPVDERRQALETLCALAPARAESVGIDLLTDGRLVTNDSHERTRELAVEMLARVATSQAARDALAAAAKGRWRNSERVREAATKGVATFETRASQPPPPLTRKPS